MLPRPLVIGLSVLVSIMWAVNLVVGLIYPGRSDPALNAIFAIVIGAAFALEKRGATVKAARRKVAQMIDPKPDPEPEQDDRGDQS